MIVKSTLTKEEFLSFPSREQIDSFSYEELIERTHRYFTFAGKPLAIYALTKHETCLEAHALVSNEIKNYKILFHEMTRNMVVTGFLLHKDRDLMVMDVDSRNCSWAKKLGFQPDNNVTELDTIEGLVTFSITRKEALWLGGQ